VLVLDEPTNDLDIDTLELLEELLQGYAGTVFLVSHDRRFLDNVVTSTIAWEGEDSPGRWREYEGGYEDWIVQKTRAQALQRETAKPRAAPRQRAAPPAEPAPRPRKLSYKDQRELDALPARIDALEAEQRLLAEQLSGGEIYAGDVARLVEAQDRVAQIEDELMAALERWEALGAG
jgi:ATP-binding cassette subfamily F protein uup